MSSQEKIPEFPVKVEFKNISRVFVFHCFAKVMHDSILWQLLHAGQLISVKKVHVFVSMDMQRFLFIIFATIELGTTNWFKPLAMCKTNI